MQRDRNSQTILKKKSKEDTQWSYLYAVRKQKLEMDMEQHTGSKLGKEYV